MAPRSSGRVARRAQRGALPTAVRTALTRTASLMISSDLFSIAQGLAGFEGVANALLRFALATEREEMLALQIKEVLFADRRAGGDVASAKDGGEVRSDGDVVISGVFAFVQHVDAKTEGGEHAVSGRGNAGDGERGLVAGFGKRDGLGPGV